jgi:sugar/nucleoside kinase (ribokinase family)
MQLIPLAKSMRLMAMISRKIILSILCVFMMGPVINAYEVLTLGGVVVDYTCFISEEELEKVSGAKGGSLIVSYDTFYQLLAENQPCLISPGGSGVNTLKGLAGLGHSCGLLGKIGSDEKGAFFLNALASRGVVSMLQQTPDYTAQCICLVTPDNERTMRTYLGPTHDFEDLPLERQAFQYVRLVHAEGYLLFNESVIERLFDAAKQAGAKISLDLGTFDIARLRREFILKVLEMDVDIVFANQDEAKALTGLDAEEACAILAAYCDIAVVTMGKNGGWLQSGQEKIYFPAYPAEVIDTTGAGDLFISGFLHGYLKGEPLNKCSRMGSIIAASVVEVMGTEFDEQRWEKIRPLLDD